jgi:hypothetical protein
MWEHKTGIQGRALIEIKDFSHGMQRLVEKARSLIPRGWETVVNRPRTVIKSEQEQGSLGAGCPRARNMPGCARIRIECTGLDGTRGRSHTAVMSVVLTRQVKAHLTKQTL